MSWFLTSTGYYQALLPPDVVTASILRSSQIRDKP